MTAREWVMTHVDVPEDSSGAAGWNMAFDKLAADQRAAPGLDRPCQRGGWLTDADADRAADLTSALGLDLALRSVGKRREHAPSATWRHSRWKVTGREHP